MILRTNEYRNDVVSFPWFWLYYESASNCNCPPNMKEKDFYLHEWTKIQISQGAICSGNTTYLFTGSQLYTALRFHNFRYASFYTSCKETRGSNARAT